MKKLKKHFILISKIKLLPDTVICLTKLKENDPKYSELCFNPILE